jgi:hypothetical protein
MKSITVKSNVKKVRLSSPRLIKNKKISPKNSTFRFAPDAAGIMKGPADLSIREGLNK